jgi:hypothetical protein
VLLEALWPQFRRKLEIIQSNIDNNKIVMTSNVTLEHVLQSHEHRRIAIQKYEQAKEFQDNLNLKLLSDMMSSPSCESTLRKAIQTSSFGTGDTTGKWLFDSTKYEMWLNGGDSKWRCIWIHGIPGAGMYGVPRESDLTTPGSSERGSQKDQSLTEGSIRQDDPNRQHHQTIGE